MPVIRQILWKVLVVGMIPFILGAGLPQMECRCAAAKGQRWCECCFFKPGESRTDQSPLKACCQRRLAKLNHDTPTETNAASGCPTCHQFKNPKTGSCCSLKVTDAPTLSEKIDAPAVNSVSLWLPTIAMAEQFLLATMTSGHDVLSRVSQIPPLDRVIVFEHLLI